VVLQKQIQEMEEGKCGQLPPLMSQSLSVAKVNNLGGFRRHLEFSDEPEQMHPSKLFLKLCTSGQSSEAPSSP
jgi:hypothetical protein